MRPGSGASDARSVPPHPTPPGASVARRPDDLARLGEVMDLVAWHRPSEPHHYLNLLGVIPDHQGAGIGSALLRSVLEIADRRGEPAYLEATSPRNRALFERHGFTVVDELCTGDCPPLWAMRRPPEPDRETGFMKRTGHWGEIASAA